MGQFANCLFVILVSRIRYPDERRSWLVQQRDCPDRQVNSFDRIEGSKANDEPFALNSKVSKQFRIDAQVTDFCIDSVAANNALSTEIRVHEQVITRVRVKPLLFCSHAKCLQIRITRQHLPRLE